MTDQQREWERRYGITEHTESRGRDFNEDGTFLTSSAGAKGRMQVMPGTISDPGFGVTPARNNSAEELARVGRDYLRAMERRYNGDMAKAWAAYNAGPGRLDKALRQDEHNWLRLMPEETRNYVRQNMTMLNGEFEQGHTRRIRRRKQPETHLAFQTPEAWNFTGERPPAPVSQTRAAAPSRREGAGNSSSQEGSPDLLSQIKSFFDPAGWNFGD